MIVCRGLLVHTGAVSDKEEMVIEGLALSCKAVLFTRERSVYRFS